MKKRKVLPNRLQFSCLSTRYCHLKELTFDCPNCGSLKYIGQVVRRKCIGKKDVFGKVCFVPWKYFDEIVSDTEDRLSNLSPLELAISNLKLVTLHFGISGPYRLPELKTTAGDIDNLKRAFNSEQTSSTEHERMGFLPNDDHLEKNDEHNLDLYASNTRGTVRHKPDSVEDVYTDEISTMGVKVFGVALALIRNLRETGRLFFKTHMFSSELVKTRCPGIEGLPLPTSVTPDQALVRVPDSHVSKV